MSHEEIRSIESIRDVVRKELLDLPRYSFVLNGNDQILKVRDPNGAFIELDAALAKVGNEL